MKRHLPFGLLSLVLSLTALSSCGGEDKLQKLHAPIVGPSQITPTKLETKWSRLTFGHYPSREIVRGTFQNVKDYAYESSDLLVDAALFQKLETAVWSNDQVTIDGVSYRRVLEPATPSSAQHYLYDDPGKKFHYFEIEPISWRVLALEGSKATLMADKAMDCFVYHPNESGAKWKDSYARSFLNSLSDAENQCHISFTGKGFYDVAFSNLDQKAILKHRSLTSINESYDVSTGEATEDYVYLLDQSEMYAGEKASKYGFYPGHGYDDPAKRFKSTMYAKFQGCWYSPVTDYRGNCFHFMRTPGYRQSYVSYICDFGYIYGRGTSADCFDAGIIPVIDVDLSKADYQVKEDRSSESMMQKAPESTGEETLGQGKWESIRFGEYPQAEVKPNDPRYEKLSQAVWVEDETTLDNVRYRKIEDRYFQYQTILWRILEKEGDAALLFSSVGLDCVPFHEALSSVTWSTSSVRSFLNDEFLATAFPEGNPAILSRKIENRPNHYFGTDCGEDTVDEAFLLCEDDMFGEEAAKKHGFAPSDATNDEGRRIVPSDYAISRGAWTSKEGNGFYSLRNSGYSNANAVYVGELGDIYNRGIPVTCPDMTLVPAMWVDLSAI